MISFKCPEPELRSNYRFKDKYIIYNDRDFYAFNSKREAKRFQSVVLRFYETKVIVANRLFAELLALAVKLAPFLTIREYSVISKISDDYDFQLQRIISASEKPINDYTFIVKQQHYVLYKMANELKTLADQKKYIYLKFEIVGITESVNVALHNLQTISDYTKDYQKDFHKSFNEIARLKVV